MSATARCQGSTWSWDAGMSWPGLSEQPGHSRAWSPSCLSDPGARAAKEMLPGCADSFKALFCF